jgi:hypothetical protein
VEILDHTHAFCETDDERIQLRNDLILALRAAGLWTRIVELNRACESAATAGRTDTNADTNADTSVDARAHTPTHATTHATTYARTHDDVELAGLEARWEVDRTIPPILERALVCLRAEHAAPGHRMRAGIWALILAHNIPDADVAEDVYRTLGDITSGTRVSDIDRLTADLIYQTAFGDLRRGADAGARLVATTRASGDLASLSRVLRLASVPLLYLGRFADVRGLLCEGLEMLERRRLRWGTYITTAGFVRSYFEEGDLESANHWYHRLRRLSDASDDLASSCPAHLLGAKIALVEHRYEAPELLDFPPLSRWETITSARAQSIAMAVWSLSTLRRGLTVEHSASIDRFRHTFDRAKYSGNQDFPAFALFEALRARGDEVLASTTLRRYVDRERRERSPLPPFLALAFESLPTGGGPRAACAAAVDR